MNNTQVYQLMDSIDFNYQKEKKMLITSSTDGEGKTYIAENLAHAYEQSGERVLLISLEDRSDQFGQHNANDLEQPVPVTDGLSYLDFSCVQEIDVLNRKSVRSLLDAYGSSFDVVVIDGGVLSTSYKTQLFSRLVDNVLVVVNQQHVGRNELLQTKQYIDSMNIDLMGIVLNEKV